jgi:hypothetical protein
MASTAPRRIDSRLLALAESSGAIYHRSGTEQLEHWATLGAAVESVMSLPTVAKLKTLGQGPDLDALIAHAGTPAANEELAKYLEGQPFPQYGVDPDDETKIIVYQKGHSKASIRQQKTSSARKRVRR